MLGAALFFNRVGANVLWIHAYICVFTLFSIMQLLSLLLYIADGIDYKLSGGFIHGLHGKCIGLNCTTVHRSQIPLAGIKPIN